MEAVLAYRERINLDGDNVENIERARLNLSWMFPLGIVQEAPMIFRRENTPLHQFLGTVAWLSVTIVLLAILMGWRLRWLSKREHQLLNDEWHRETMGDASRWGLAALVVIGGTIMLCRPWVSIDAGLAIYALVNGALATAVLRFWLLNRGTSQHDG